MKIMSERWLEDVSAAIDSKILKLLLRMRHTKISIFYGKIAFLTSVYTLQNFVIDAAG